MIRQPNDDSAAEVSAPMAVPAARPTLTQRQQRRQAVRRRKKRAAQFGLRRLFVITSLSAVGAALARALSSSWNVSLFLLLSPLVTYACLCIAAPDGKPSLARKPSLAGPMLALLMLTILWELIGILQAVVSLIPTFMSG